MRKNGAAAAAYLKKLQETQAWIQKNRCLRYCRLAWDLPPQDASAWEEWQSIPESRKHRDPLAAPVGAPHFWKSPLSKYGHIALQSEIQGFVYSTDAPKANRVGLVSFGWFKKRWRSYRYLGWATELQGRKLPLTVQPKEQA